MNKEELKKEVEEWIAKNSKEFITNPNYSPFDYAEAIYFAGAEPREKRIDCLTLACENYREEMGMMEQTENLLKQLSSTLEAFKQDTGKEPTLVIVSAEIFARIMPALENIKHDKSYSEGKLGSVTIKSDFLIQDDNMIVTRPPEWDDKFPLAECLLPVIPPFAALYQKKRKTLKEKVKDFLKRRKRK